MYHSQVRTNRRLFVDRGGREVEMKSHKRDCMGDKVRLSKRVKRCTRFEGSYKDGGQVPLFFTNKKF